jgi:peptide/nickel transport system permease protein
LNAIENSDLPVVVVVVVLAASFIVIMNTVVDIVYALLDPRVRLG